MRFLGSSSGSVAILGATILFDRDFLERFDITTVESSECTGTFPAEDSPPFGVPLAVPRLLGLTLETRLRSNEFSCRRDENPSHHDTRLHRHRRRIHYHMHHGQ